MSDDEIAEITTAKGILTTVSRYFPVSGTKVLVDYK